MFLSMDNLIRSTISPILLVIMSLGIYDYELGHDKYSPNEG